MKYLLLFLLLSELQTNAQHVYTPPVKSAPITDHRQMFVTEDEIDSLWAYLKSPPGAIAIRWVAMQHQINALQKKVDSFILASRGGYNSLTGNADFSDNPQWQQNAKEWLLPKDTIPNISTKAIPVMNYSISDKHPQNPSLKEINYALSSIRRIKLLFGPGAYNAHPSEGVSEAIDDEYERLIKLRKK